MTSLGQGMESHYNGRIAFKNAVYKNLINKDVYFCFRFFCQSVFTNNTTSFLTTGYTEKYRSVVKHFPANVNAVQLHELFYNGFWAIMTSKVCFEDFYGNAFGTLI